VRLEPVSAFIAIPLVRGFSIAIVVAPANFEILERE
jgi:hypothetical protein